MDTILNCSENELYKLNNFYKNQFSNEFYNMIETHSNYGWHWYTISKNPNITMDIIEANLDKHWNWNWISGNPNITWDIIEK